MKNGNDLRQRAEARLTEERSEPQSLTAAEMQRLIHEFHVHQIELEMQNHELDLACRHAMHLAEELKRHRDDLESLVAVRTEQLREMAVKATLAEEHERQAIAQDLHDDLGQMLYVVQLKLDDLRAHARGGTREALDELVPLVAGMNKMVRTLTSQLCPPGLHKLGLMVALDWLAGDMSNHYGLAVEIEDDGMPKPLGAAKTITLFRTIRELLINVSRHSTARSARVRAQVVAGKLALVVEDAGSGIANLEVALSEAQGFGLASVRDRIVYLGGNMDIRTTAGEGTSVILTVPLTPENPTGPAIADKQGPRQ